MIAQRPEIDAKRDAEDKSTCSLVKAPRIKIVLMIGSFKAIMPHIDGIPKSSTNLIPHSKVFTYLSLFTSISILDKAGKITVEIATAKIPIGNSSKRSE